MNVTKQIIGLLLMCTVGSVYALGEQLYFVGMVAPVGSISNAGSATNAVYLRWDVTEGKLPADVTKLLLFRDGVEIFSADPHAVLAGNEIDALYVGPEQDRRKQEVILSLLDEGQVGALVDSGNLGEKIKERLAIDTYWPYLMSRMDFNVARARNRGFLDTTATLPHQYELYALHTDGVTQALVGRVDVSAPVAQVLPAAVSFDQVSNLGRCDAPGETRKDHGTVALDWDIPGGTAGDRYTHAILSTSYDIYRTTSNYGGVIPVLPAPTVAVEDPPSPVAPLIDIRALAQAQGHDNNGDVTIPGYERVNNEPILISGNASHEILHEDVGSWNPGFSQFMETPDLLLSAGLEPGDSRLYYLVPRDFTGNYGDTVGIIVTVPDSDAPPAPWAVRSVEHVGNPLTTVDDELFISWDQVDVLGYHRRHQHGRVYCNLNTARLDQELRFVPEGKNCDDHPNFVVDLDVDHYLVYRFENQHEAGQFTDTDGDGRSDRGERIPANVTDSDLTRTTIGTACNSASFPTVAVTPNRLVEKVLASTATSRASGRKVLEFHDPTPSTNKGQVYWYRLASVDSSGNLSGLSSPVRGFFPDSDLPPRINPSTITFGREICTYQVIQTETFFEFAVDQTRDADSVRVDCGEPVSGGGPLFSTTFPIVTLASGDAGVEPNTEQCAQLTQNCRDLTMSVDYLQGGQSLAGLSSYAQFSNCPTSKTSVNTVLQEDCGQLITIKPGDVVGKPTLNVPIPAGMCLNIYRDYNGKTHHYKTICPPQTLQSPDLAGLGGNQVCLSLAYQNQNNEVGPKYALPCFIQPPSGPPDAPQPVVMAFPGAASSEISWMPPEAQVIGTLVEWYRDGDAPGSTSGGSEFFAHPGQGTNEGIIKKSIPIIAEPAGVDWEELWCFRLRSVGKPLSGSTDGTLSEWSAVRCDVRVPAGAVLPNYIPWPKIPTPPLGDELFDLYLQGDGLPVVRMSDAPVLFSGQCEYESAPTNCIIGNKQTCLSKARAAVIGLCGDFCSSLRASMADKMNFVVYRQSTDNVADALSYSEYVQVSPLVNELRCDTAISQSASPQGTLLDPYFSLVDFTLSPPDRNWDGLRMIYVDNAPHIGGRWYRYQFVYFGVDGEIIKERLSAWVEAN